MATKAKRCDATRIAFDPFAENSMNKRVCKSALKYIPIRGKYLIINRPHLRASLRTEINAFYVLTLSYNRDLPLKYMLVIINDSLEMMFRYRVSVN